MREYRGKSLGLSERETLSANAVSPHELFRTHRDGSKKGNEAEEQMETKGNLKVDYRTGKLAVDRVKHKRR